MPPPAPTDFGGEWKLTEVMRNRRMSSLNPGEISRRSHRFILCFSTRSSDVEFGVCVCEPVSKTSEGVGSGEGSGGKAHTQARSSSEQEQRGAGSQAAGSGEWKFTAACERLCMSKRSFLLTLFQRLAVARQEESGRPNRGIARLVAATCR